jgi:hypothetical protein
MTLLLDSEPLPEAGRLDDGQQASDYGVEQRAPDGVQDCHLQSPGLELHAILTSSPQSMKVV